MALIGEVLLDGSEIVQIEPPMEGRVRNDAPLQIHLPPAEVGMEHLGC